MELYSCIIVKEVEEDFDSAVIGHPAFEETHEISEGAGPDSYTVLGLEMEGLIDHIVLVHPSPYDLDDVVVDRGQLFIKPDHPADTDGPIDQPVTHKCDAAAVRRPCHGKVVGTQK